MQAHTIDLENAQESPSFPIAPREFVRHPLMFRAVEMQQWTHPVTLPNEETPAQERLADFQLWRLGDGNRVRTSVCLDDPQEKEPPGETTTPGGWTVSCNRMLKLVSQANWARPTDSPQVSADFTAA
jgi:hypothetical protein